ncbi:MAG: AraC family transcriptional regulator [Oscillospiraceae bacterium]|nr:AraC family transcriptional regulator [Oscillospiraceae bacterium]
MYFSDYPIIRNEKNLPLYLLNMGQHHCQDHIIRAEGYPNHQILYCTKGSGTLIIDEKHIPIPPNTAIYLPAGHPHEYYPEEDVWDIHWVVPSGYAAEDILKQFGLDRPQVLNLNNTKILDNTFRKMHDAIRSDSIFGNYRASGYLYDFLIELYRIISAKGTSASPSPALMKAIDYINCNYASEITMNDLCAVSGVTKQHLCLLFRNIMNMRPMEYIAKRRIQEAKSLLTGTAKSIEAISFEIGFCSESYFCMLFKRYEGITPSAFRNTK